MPDTQSETRLRQILAFVLVATIIGGTVDLILDRPSSLWSAHVIYELLLISAAAVTMMVLWRGWFVTRQSLVETRKTLEQQRAERDAWRASAESALAGLGRAIDERFHSWGLTPTEREIALLLLKGRSHKEIAFATRRSERTVRQHAVAVYEKSGLGGRAELAAFFLGDLTLPGDPPGSADATASPRR